MDIDRLNPISHNRLAGGDIGDLLTRLRAAGSVEAEVMRVLGDRLLLRSELGEILTRNRLDLRPGDRLRLRLGGSDSEPVLRATPVPGKPATIAFAEVPRLARALPADRPALAEIVRALPRATEIRLAGHSHTLPLRIEPAGGRLLSLERRPATGSIELRPLERAPIYRALLRHLLPHQAPGDGDSLLRLLEHARTPPPPPARSPEVPPRATAAPGPAATAPAAARPPAPATTVTTAQRPPPPSTIDPQPRLVTPTIAAGPRAQTPPLAPASRPGPASIAAASGDPRPALSASVSQPAPAATRPVPATPSSPTRARIDPSARPSSAAADPARAGADAAPVRPALPSRSPAAPGPAAAAITAPLAHLLEWLPRSAELDAPRLRHWIELLGFARPAAADGTRAPDLIDWLRQLQAFDPPARAPVTSASRRGATPGGAEAQPGAGDNRDSAPAPPRDSLRLVEQALTHNLLQRAAAGLQQETQQPLNLSLTLPFVDGAELRPLRLELEQRSRRGEADGESAWDVRVSFEFGALGPITCHLVLSGRALAASFYCHHDATRERVASALPELRRQLNAAGFEPGELHSFAGRARAPQAAAAIGAEFLIDLEA